jgi:putative PIN family toxin of toxin-antitoxin system
VTQQGAKHICVPFPTEAPGVLDTHVVLDLWLFEEPKVAALRLAVESGNLRWYASASTLNETQHVVDRGFSGKFTAVSANKTKLLAACRRWAQIQPDPGKTPNTRLSCRDTDDQKFVELALGHAPSWLLTRDKDLLALARRARPWGVAIATPEQWLAQRPTC